MFENPRRGRQARNFTTNVPKILDLKSSSEQKRVFIVFDRAEISSLVGATRPEYPFTHSFILCAE